MCIFVKDIFEPHALITSVEFYFRLPVSIVSGGIVSKMIVAICSPRINNFCTFREHSTSFRLTDLAFTVGMAMLRCFNRSKHSRCSASTSSLSSFNGMAVLEWWYFFRFHTSNTSLNTMFQCLSNASMKPITWPFIVLAFRVNICKNCIEWIQENREEIL